MSAAARQVARQLLRCDAPSVARGFKTSASPKYHYVSGGAVPGAVAPTQKPRGGRGAAGRPGARGAIWGAALGRAIAPGRGPKAGGRVAVAS
jgi:hypothetical protein